jgi:hypothetical protein
MRADMVATPTMPTKQVHPIQFGVYSGGAFEQLVFAFHLRTGRWRRLEWYGQVGSDLGRDILAIRDDDSAQGEALCIQCANHRSLPAAKAIRDLNKAITSPTRPRRMRFVCGGNVSASVRDKIRAHASKLYVDCEVWSGGEFEERLRHEAESLLRRFAEGVEFPDIPSDLARFVQDLPASDDSERVASLARLFDRPAFYTPFHSESSIPSFREALDDTIRALSTGVRQTREGVQLERIPSRHNLKGNDARNAFAEIERSVAHLRANLDELVRAGEIRPCRDHCGNPECSVYEFSVKAIRDMDNSRSSILDRIRAVHPTFTVRVGWR